MKKIFVESIKSWIAHRSASKGAALAFYTLFSLTPILVLAIAVAGYFFGAEAAQGEIIAQIQDLVGPNGAQVIQALLAGARNQTSGLVASVLASVLLLVGATSVFVELKESLDEIWGVAHSQHSAILSLLRKRLLAFGLVIVLALLLFISLVASAVLAVFGRYAGEMLDAYSIVISCLSWFISFSVIASLFAVIFKMLPDVLLSWFDVWIGAIFTAVLFSLGKYAIGLYLRKSGVTSIFGAAGSLIALLLWVYYSAQIFFLGVEFTRQYTLRIGSQKRGW